MCEEHEKRFEVWLQKLQCTCILVRAVTSKSSRGFRGGGGGGGGHYKSSSNVSTALSDLPKIGPTL